MGFATQTDNYRDHNNQVSNGIALQEGWDYSNGTLTVNEKSYNDIIQFPGALSQAQYDQNPRQASDNKDYFHYQTQIFQLSNQNQLDSNWRLAIHASSTEVKNDGYFFNPIQGSENVLWLDSKLIGDFPGKKMTFGYTGEASAYKNYADANTSSTVNIGENELYIHNLFSLNPKWQLTLGARGARQDNNPQQTLTAAPYHYLNRVFVTEQGLNYLFSSNFFWYVRRAGNFRFPKANEEVWLPNNITELQPQTGVSYETGLEWHTSRQKAQLNIYKLKLHNELAYDPTETPEQPFGATTNFPETIHKGISLTDDFNLNNKLGLNTEMNYVDARFAQGANINKFIPAVPMWQGDANFHYQINDRWRWTYGEQYTGSQYVSEDITNVSKKQSSYFLAKSSIQYFYRQFTFGMMVNNIFNQRYATYAYYNLGDQSNYYYPASGRNYLFTFKASLA